VLVYSNRHIEVLTQDRDSVVVKFVELPEVAGTKPELLLEQYTQHRLKYLWARIFKEGDRIAIHAIRRWSLLDEFDKELRLAFSKELDSLKIDGVQA
jgi:hypothetical protein